MFRKSSVLFGGVKPEVVLAMMLSRHVFLDFGYEFIISSVTDGEHGEFSYHPSGYAFDVRLPAGLEHVSGKRLRQSVHEAVGPEFDVVLEDAHIHVEFEVRRSK